MKKYALPILHVLIIIVAYSSPWFIPWQVVFGVFLLYRLQFIMFGNCLLSFWQFNDKKETFFFHYIKKVFPNANQKSVDFFTDWVLPFGAVVTAFIIQN